MRFLKRLAIGLALLLAAAMTVVWMQPDDYRVTRSTEIVAPLPAVFARVNDLRQWESWSPWAKLDPNAKITFTGPQAGVGASFAWDGNDKVGAGTMSIIESKTDERIATRTDFVKPFEGTSRSDFLFFDDRGAPDVPESWQRGHTRVIWSMSGQQSFIGKAICLVMNMEKTLGPDFERGLAQLKQVSEAK